MRRRARADLPIALVISGRLAERDQRSVIARAPLGNGRPRREVPAGRGPTLRAPRELVVRTRGPIGMAGVVKPVIGVAMADPRRDSGDRRVLRRQGDRIATFGDQLATMPGVGRDLLAPLAQGRRAEGYLPPAGDGEASLDAVHSR